MIQYIVMPMSLHLFDGAAAGGATSGAQGSGGTQGAVPSVAGKGNTGDAQRVVYGKQTVTDAQEQPSDAGKANESTGVQTTSDALEAKRKAYKDLVNGEYKDQYTEDTQQIINRRFKEFNNLQARVDATQPLIDMLMQRYDIKDGDIKKLTSALDNDNAYWSEAADEAGMTVEQYKQFQKLQRENEQLMRERKAAQGRQFVQEQTAKWYQEAEAVKGKFPGFNFEAEIKNPQFMAMLKAGTPVEHAYKVLHLDEILGQTVNNTAAATEKRVVDSIRARGSRPAENGLSGQSGITYKDDVSKLSRADRAEIARRVARGERISF